MLYEVITTLATHPLAKVRRAFAMSTLEEITGTPTALIRATGDRTKERRRSMSWIIIV